MNSHYKIEMGAKDFSGRFIDINDTLLQCLGYRKKEDVLGRSEYDIGREVFAETIGGSDALIKQFLLGDEKAFRGKEFTALDVHKWRGELRFMIWNKFPLKNGKGKIYAAGSSGYEIFQPSIQCLEHYLSLEKNGLTIYEQGKKHIQDYINELLNKNPLTKRELECISLLAKGKTAKEIAQTLQLSPRTVEFYLDNAKDKLKCINRYELIAMCFNKGWLQLDSTF